MHENAPNLTADRRERLGTKYSKRLRDQGKLPAILYGHGEDPLPLALDATEAINHIQKGEKVFQITMNGSTETALLRDLQFDYLGTNIIHADFSRVNLSERIHSRVHIKLVGDSVGLKTAGAVLMHPVTELDIECIVSELPDEIEVDISELAAGDSLHVSDVRLPGDSMKILTDGHGVVAQIVVQGEEKAGEEAEAGAASQPEVLTEKKDKEQGEKK